MPIKPVPEKKNDIISTVVSVVNNDTVAAAIKIYSLYKIIRIFV